MTKLPKDNRLHELLLNRVNPLESEDFAARIISASRNVTQRRNVSVAVWLRRIFTEFKLPTPAYAIASILVVGFIIGLGMQDFELSEPANLASSQDSIFNEESYL